MGVAEATVVAVDLVEVEEAVPTWAEEEEVSVLAVGEVPASAVQELAQVLVAGPESAGAQLRPRG